MGLSNTSKPAPRSKQQKNTVLSDHLVSKSKQNASFGGTNNNEQIIKQQQQKALLERKIEKLKQEIENLSSEIKQKKTEEQKFEKERLKLTQSIDGMKKKINNNEQELSQKTIEVQLLQKQLQQEDQKIRKLKVNYSNLIRNEKREKNKFQELNTKIADADKELVSKKEQLIKATREKNDFQRQLSELQGKRTKNNSILLKLEEENSRKAELIRQIQQLRAKIDTSTKETQQKITQSRHRERQIEKYGQIIGGLQELITIIERQNRLALERSRQYGHLFAGDVLEDQEDHRQFLVQLLEKHIRYQIDSTRLIYRYDPMNMVNFHRYIDNQSQIVLLIRLPNRYVLGAWAQGCFLPKTISNREGLIFSLTNRKQFSLTKPGIKAITYDDYFLIFGNSEIRLRTQQSTVFSNFGINNSYYNNKGENVNTLLGSGSTREVQMQTFQIFQLRLR